MILCKNKLVNTVYYIVLRFNVVIISELIAYCYDGLTGRHIVKWKQNTDTN